MEASMKLYNTLTRQVEEIQPLKPPAVTVYTCGPTVYDYPHIGNWFTFIRYDLLVRTLQANGLQTKWVMNITDVGHLTSDADEGEDKLEKGAQREGKTAWDVARKYTEYFLHGLERLNIQTPNQLPKATEHIEEQIALIKALEDRGYTYRIDDGIYYDTAKFPGYADFARLDLDALQAGARVSHNPQKHNSSDFALWKFSPTDHTRDMEWDSPWGTGFPGWHLECSAISMKYLGPTLDIHSGGIDHIPVHHTNEIAQSEAATGKRFANIWLHTNHILIEDEKISKSLGNGITLEDVEARGYDMDTLRLLVLESHYRSQSKFSWDAMAATKNRLQDLRAMAALRHQPVDTVDTDSFSFVDIPDQLRLIMAEDLATPAALAYLSEVCRQVLATLVHPARLEHFNQMLQAVDSLLGTQLYETPDITGAQKQLINERDVARRHKDWQKSDELRDRLVAEGIGLRDHDSHTTVWYYL
jgi:cysteinyl-tRNA synthetase